MFLITEDTGLVGCRASLAEAKKPTSGWWSEVTMGTNQDGKKWQYACQNCGTPYTSKPKFCYDCGYRTILPIAALQNTTADCDE
jgi:uncharacterized OB-fold protein